MYHISTSYDASFTFTMMPGDTDELAWLQNGVWHI